MPEETYPAIRALIALPDTKRYGLSDAQELAIGREYRRLQQSSGMQYKTMAAHLGVPATQDVLDAIGRACGCSTRVYDLEFAFELQELLAQGKTLRLSVAGSRDIAEFSATQIARRQTIGGREFWVAKNDKYSVQFNYKDIELSDVRHGGVGERIEAEPI